MPVISATQILPCAKPMHTPIPEEPAPSILSIVTVCYNSALTIGETMASIDRAVCGTAPGTVDHLVVDGLSTDNTLRVVKRFDAPYRRLLHEQDSGIYNAMNKGVGLARGKYVWFINSDDLVDPYASCWMGELLETLDKEEYEVLVGELKMFRGRTGHRQLTRIWHLPQNIERARRFGWLPPHPAFIAKRSLIMALGGFDERRRLSADIKLMDGALRSSRGRIGRFPHNLTLMREGGVSTASLHAVLRCNAECYRIFRESGYGSVRAGIEIVMRLTRKVFQKGGAMFAGGDLACMEPFR